MERPRKRRNQAKSVAVACNQLPGCIGHQPGADPQIEDGTVADPSEQREEEALLLGTSRKMRAATRIPVSNLLRPQPLIRH
jgi:hypothetical protein